MLLKLPLPVLVVYVFAATALFSGSFFLGYETGSRFITIGIIVGIAAALSWPVFISALSVASSLSFGGALRACVYAMAVGNTVLLGSVALNTCGWALGWTSPFLFHMLIIGASNLAMFLTLFRVTRGAIGLAALAALWIVVLNGLFAIIVTLAVERFVS